MGVGVGVQSRVDHGRGDHAHLKRGTDMISLLSFLLYMATEFHFILKGKIKILGLKDH